MWRMRSPSESVVSWLVSRAVPLETRQAGIAEANADYDVQPPSLVRRGAEIFCVRHRVSHVSAGGRLLYCLSGGGVPPLAAVPVMTFMASAIIEPTSAALAGRMRVFVVLASSPNWAMYCS